MWGHITSWIGGTHDHRAISRYGTGEAVGATESAKIRHAGARPAEGMLGSITRWIGGTHDHRAIGRDGNGSAVGAAQGGQDEFTDLCLRGN